jgi:hypothetical protein
MPVQGATFMTHMFDMRCRENGIEHGFTKINRPWTNGQVERMNRTIKEATVQRYHYDSHQQLSRHLDDFVRAYNFGRRLKTLNGLTSVQRSSLTEHRRERTKRTIAKLNSKGAAAMSEYLNEMIGCQVKSTAEWRRVKAEQFPDDHRNLVAAEELEELAAQINRIGESEPIHYQIATLHDRFNAATDSCGNGDAWMYISEAVSDELRSIGFHCGYETGLKLLEWYRDLLQEKLDEILDEAVPVPNLNEQIENDPAVKAAKRAYDEARAKAYAEARKRL